MVTVKMQNALRLSQPEGVIHCFRCRSLLCAAHLLRHLARGTCAIASHLFNKVQAMGRFGVELLAAEIIIQVAHHIV